jgi:predicted PurR-regulated permease PerM
VNPRLYRVLLWFGMASAGIVGPALLQDVPAPFVAAFAIGFLRQAAVDRLELSGTRRSCADLVA